MCPWRDDKQIDRYVVSDSTTMVTASIQARMGSTRLPGKVLLSIRGRRTIDLVRQRCEAASNVDHIVFTIGDEASNEAIIKWCDRNGHHYVVGPEEDLLARHRLSLDQTEDGTLVRVTSDCPFVPPSEIDRLVDRHVENGKTYTSNATDRMPVGTAVDVLDRSVLRELAERGETHPAVPLRESPDEWGAVIDDSAAWAELGAAHTAVDTPSDYWALVDAVRAVGFDPREVTEWIAENR